MNKKTLLGSLILLVSLIGGLVHAGAKIGGNPTTVGASSLLELESTNKGLVISRVANTAAIASPMNGMLIYDSSANCVKGYQNNAWSGCMKSTQDLTDLDCTASALDTGRLVQNTAASDVTSSLLYTGGGGTNYSSTSVNSTGVTGLTATLESFGYDTASDGGFFVYSITGTPTSAGTATFPFTIGGQSCNLSRTVVSATPAVTALNCAGAVFDPAPITSGVAYAGTISVPYTGGNGNAYPQGTAIASTGVTGLSAQLSAGTLATGAGNLSYAVTGTASAGGTANFAISFGGQSCTVAKTVNTNPGTIASGSSGGGLVGRTCFDIAESNNNVGICSALSTRATTRSDFNQTTTKTQTYYFTPTGTVSNVRFAFVNTNGQVISSISGGNAGNNLSGTITGTAVFNTNLSSPNPAAPSTGLAKGRTGSNPLTADIYVIYNDGATNNGTDRQTKLTVTVKDCACCGAEMLLAYIPGEMGGNAALFNTYHVQQEFMCHNLGANTSLNPFAYNNSLGDTNGADIKGDLYQWGRRTDGHEKRNSTVTNTQFSSLVPNSALFYAPSTTTGTSWDWLSSGQTTSRWGDGNTTGTGTAYGTGNGNLMTNTPVKGPNDPCPAGYKVPSLSNWAGIVNNVTGIIDPVVNITSLPSVPANIWRWTGNGYMVGSSLYLPAAGSRGGATAVIANTGVRGAYWSSSVGTSGSPAPANVPASYLSFNQSTGEVLDSAVVPRSYGQSVRCMRSNN